MNKMIPYLEEGGSEPLVSQADQESIDLLSDVAYLCPGLVTSLLRSADDTVSHQLDLEDSARSTLLNEMSHSKDDYLRLLAFAGIITPEQRSYLEYTPTLRAVMGFDHTKELQLLGLTGEIVVPGDGSISVSEAVQRIIEWDERLDEALSLRILNEARSLISAPEHARVGRHMIREAAARDAASDTPRRLSDATHALLAMQDESAA